ncbi:MAG: hypothetical protein HIU93_03155 [Acidobacteria bacterium]|nr:hypothetical protein [Acidobacteriota bacterium]MBW4044490.1 hypothetical protein [Acidobacteriota bacterium]
MISAFRTLRAAIACSVLLAASSAPIFAQVTATAPIATVPQYNERWDVYGGFSYAHFNPGAGEGSTLAATNLFGWNGDANLWFSPLFAIEASARGYYGNIPLPPNKYVTGNPPMSENLFLFGPDFRFIRKQNYAAGFHTLIGAAYGSFDKGFPPGIQPQIIGVYNNKLAFGSAVGAWYDHNLSPKWSVRITTDWQPTHYGLSWQNEFAGTAGIVYKLGSLKK